jgi:Putative Zn-dependent protease, contains TPR repeats
MPRVSPKNKSLKSEPAPAGEVPSGHFEIWLLKLLLIVIAGLLVYAPAFHGDWLWDDDQEITQNAILTDPQGLIKIWKGESGADYFPLKSTVQWIYFRGFGTDRTAWHLLNVGLHLVNALLFWKVLARLGIRQAWLGGLIFSIHPILIESVAWVSELKNTLSLPFLLLAMLTWISFDERGRVRDLLLAFVFYLMAVLCKTSVVMFPCVILLYSWWRDLQGDRPEGEFSFKALDDLAGKLPILARGLWRAVLASVPFFLLSACAAWWTIEFQHDRAIGSETIPVGNLLSRTEIAGISVWFYLWKTVFPFKLFFSYGLLPIYPRWTPQIWMLVSWPVLAAILFWLWLRRKTWGRHVLLGFGFFLINLFPVLGFITMSYMRITWTADHFLYLPALGIIGLGAAGLGFLYDRADRHNQTLLAGLGAAVLAVLTIYSHRYAGIFANEYEMWTYTLKYNPDAWQAHSRLGKVLIERGEHDRAFHHIGQSRKLRPDLAETHNNYGAMLEKRGDINGALAELREAVRLAPDIHIYKINLASLCIRANRYQEGLEVYQELLREDPDNPTFLCNLGVAQYFLNQTDAAIESFERALRIRPDLRDAWENLQQAKKKRESERAGTPAPAAASDGPPVQAPGMLDSGSEIRLFGN